jgi:hypothetical protein
MAYEIIGNAEDDKTTVVIGDSSGSINIISFSRRFFIEYTNESEPPHVKPSSLNHRDDNPFKSSVTLHRVRVTAGRHVYLLESNSNYTCQKRAHHDNEWVEKVQYFKEINAVVSCSGDPIKSLVVSDLGRKVTRCIGVPKGLRCFDYCRRPSFLVTGGRDKLRAPMMELCMQRNKKLK